MAKKRANKNLVASLTMAGMAVTIGLAGVVTLAASKRDPTIYSKRAEEFLERGGPENLLRASDFFARAYQIGRDSKYIVASADCAFRAGDLSKSIRMLLEAAALRPNDVDVLEAILAHTWEVRIQIPELEDTLRDRSEQLLAIEPDNVLALACRYEWLRRQIAKDPSNEVLAEQVLHKAASLAPTDPRVAMCLAQSELARAQKVRAEQPVGAMTPEGAGRIEQCYQAAVAALRAALEKNPGNVELALESVRILMASNRVDECRELLEQAVQVNPQAWRLHERLASVTLLAAMRARDRDRAPPETLQELTGKARRHAEEAVRLSPVSYAASGTLADLETFDLPAGPIDDAGVEKIERAMKLYDAAFARALGERSLDALLAVQMGEPVQLLAKAFDTASEFRTRARAKPHVELATRLAQRFLERAQTEYPTYYLTAVMEGETALFRGDKRGAISAFERAEDRIATVRNPEPRIVTGVKERLALLYMEVGEPGLALSFAEKAIKAYEDERRVAPFYLWALRVDLTIKLGDPQKALVMLDGVASKYPQSEPLRRMRALALQELKRYGDVARELGEPSLTDAPAQLLHAQLAVKREDWATAEKHLRIAIELEPRNAAALQLWVTVMREAGRVAEGLELLKTLREDQTDERFLRSLESYEITLGTADKADRDAKIKALVETIPDVNERTLEMFRYYYSRAMYAEAKPWLAELAKLRPDDVDVLRQQFALALRLEDYPLAEQCVAQLTRLNADRAGGRRYLAQLKFMRGDFEGALLDYQAVEREFRSDSELKARIGEVLLRLPTPRLDEALNYLHDAVRFNPLNFTANKLLYVVYDKLGRREEGIPFLRRAAEIDPDEENVRTYMLFLEEESDPRKGIASREKIRAEKPDDTANVLRLCELYASLFESGRFGLDERAAYVAQADACLQAAAAARPDDPTLARAGFRIHASLRRREEGEKFLRAFIETQSGAKRIDARLLLGRFLEALGDRAAALAELNAAAQAVDETVPDPEDRRRAHVSATSELVDFFSRGNQVESMLEAAEKLLAHLTDEEALRTTRLHIIDGLLRAARYAEAREQIDKFTESSPRDHRGLIARAQWLLAVPQTDPQKRQEALTESRELMTRVLRERPDTALALHLRGVCNLELARDHGQRHLLTEARADLVRSKSIAPRDFNMIHRSTLAKVYEELKDIQLAEQELVELVDDNPDSAAYLAQLLRFLDRTKQPRKAQQYLAERCARDPNSPYWPHQLGRLLNSQKEHSAAVRYLKDARAAYERLGKSNSEIMTDLLRSLVGSKLGREAAETFERMEPKLITPTIRAIAAEGYALERQESKMRAQLESALLEGMQSGPAELERVVTQMQTLLADRPNDAAAMYDRALRSAGGTPGALFLQNLYARFLVSLGTAPARTEARRLLDDVIGKAISGSSTRIAALMIRAQLEEYEGLHEAAIATYEAVVAQDQNHVEALNNLAYLLSEDPRRVADALPYAERLHALIGRAVDAGQADRTMQVNVLDTIGWVYLQNDRLPPAEAALQEAYKLDATNFAVRLHLGVALVRLQRRADAKRLLEALRDEARAAKMTEYVQKAEEALAQIR